MKRIRPAGVAVHTWVVAYDIEDDPRRRRIAKILEAHGRRVQFSVFECRLDQEEARRLRTRIAALLEPETDRLRWYPLCRPCLRQKARQGLSRLGARIEREGFVVV